MEAKAEHVLYDVNVCDMCARQSDDSYMHEQEQREPERIYSGASLDEARDAMAKAVAERGSWYSVIEADYGLDAVEYKSIEIVAWSEGYPEGEVVDACDTLPESVRKRMDESQRSYHEFLDYERDSYFGVESNVRRR